jgi:hypothetical protein
MPPNPELIDRLYRDKVEAARRQTPEERVLASFELTEFVYRTIADGVRDQFPQASDEEVQRLTCERIARVKRLQERR